MPSSSALLGSTPDEAWGDRIQAYTTTGAPSDCVALALLGILPQKPDLVVSGINQGANFGHDLTYSGTVAAAMEAVIFGLPAIAVSLDTADERHPADERQPADEPQPEVGVAPCGRPPDYRHDFYFAAQVAARVIRQVEERGLPPGMFLNVNVPGRSPGETNPRAPWPPSVVITRLGRRVYRDVLIERQDPRGRPYYWIGGEPPSGHLDEGTDIWAVANGYVSITPVHLDMTAHDLIPTLQDWQFQ